MSNSSSPAVQALSASIHRDAFLTPVLQHATPELTDSLFNYPYQLDPRLVEKIRAFGVAASPLAAKAHPHPYHKTLELFQYNAVLPSLLNEPTTVLFMKPSKFERLAQRIPTLVCLRNQVLTGRDLTRYTHSSPLKIDTPLAYMDYALMFYSPEQIAALFISNPRMHTLYCTLIVPPECRTTSQSFEPDIYKFVFSPDGRTLHYYLEHSANGHYEQPASSHDWLSINQITSDCDLRLTVTLHSTHLSHHVFIISRQAANHLDDTRAFDAPDAVLIPQPDGLALPDGDRLVPRAVYDSLFSYVRSVRTLRDSDPSGLIRMHRSKPEHNWVTPAAWDALIQFAHSTYAYRPELQFTLQQTWFSQLRCQLSRWLDPRWNFYSGLLYAAASGTAFFYLRYCSSRSGFTLPTLTLFRLTEEPCSRFCTPFADLLPAKPTGDHLWPRIIWPIANCHWLLLNRIHTLLHPKSTLRFSPRLQLHFIKAAFQWMPWTAHAALSFIPPFVHSLFRRFGPSSAYELYTKLAHPAPFTLLLPCHGVHVSAELVDFMSHLRCHQALSPEPDLPHVSPEVTVPTVAPVPVSPSGEPFLPPESAFQPIQTLSPPHDKIAPVDSALTPLPPLKAPTSPQPETLPDLPPDTRAPVPHQVSSAPIIPAAAPLPNIQQEPFQAIVPDRAGLATSTPASVNPGLNDYSPKLSSASALPTINQIAPATGTVPTIYELPEFVAQAPVAAQASSAAPFCSPVGPPTSGPQRPTPASPLDTDPSAAPGVSEPFYLIHNYPPANDIMWPSRRRLGGASCIPIPLNRCLLNAVSDVVPRQSAASLWARLCEMLPDSQLDNDEIRSIGLSTEHLSALAWSLQAYFTVVSEHTGHYGNPKAQANRHYTIYHANNHFYSTPPKRGATATNKTRKPRHSDYSALHKFVTKDGHRLPFAKIHQHTGNRSRAKNLISNMKNLYDGVLLSTDSTNLHQRMLDLDRCIDVTPMRSVSLIHLAGAPGCGKTAPLAEAILSLGWTNRVRVAVPTTNLRPEWRRHLKLDDSQGYRVSTWETALTKTAEIIIVDEVYRMPNGYLDLLISADPNVRLVILLGDPVQAHYHSTHPSSTNHTIQPEYKYLAPYRDYYCAYSYRIPRDVCAQFGLGAFSKTEKMLITSSSIPDPRLPILVISQHVARAFSDFGYHAITWASSQGLDVKGPVVLHIDRNVRLTSQNVILVALTRSKTGVIFTGDVSHLRQSSGILHALLTKTPYSYVSAFADYIGNSTIIYEPLAPRHIGGSSRPPPTIARNAKVNHQSEHDVISNASVLSSETTPGNSDPYYLPTQFVPPSRQPLHHSIAPVMPQSGACEPDGVADPLPITPVIPGECFETLASSFMPANDPATRERYFKGELTRQFPYINREFQLGPQPLSLLAPLHSPSSDPTLLASSIDKRLRFRPSADPYQITANDEFFGGRLFAAWSSLQKLPSSTLFEPELFAECINVNEYAQLTNKTKNVIANNADRSDPDWRYTWVRIFAKAQHKVNGNSLFTDYKACQTLALMHDYVILMLGPVKKYQRVIHARHRPDNIYIHAAHSPQEMSDYCQRHLHSQLALTNDYTAFDQSQHGEAVVFERLKMQQLNIPQELIDLHVHLKTNVQTQFGPLTCMRLTGEPGTYDDNTDYNLAVLALRYNLSRHHTIFVSGDDSAIFPPPTSNPEWTAVEKLISLRFKIQIDPHPLFCGYYLGPSGACRDPLALFAKFAIAYDAGELELKMASYVAEFSIGHLLGDAVFQLLPPTHIIFYSAVFDLICRRATVDQKTILNLHVAPEHRLFRFLQRARYLTYTAARVLQAFTGRLFTVTAPGDLPLDLSVEGELLRVGHHGTAARDPSLSVR
nr:polyprotein [Bee Macula-like virus]